MTDGDRPRIAILGGGMGGLSTAWELTAGDWRERYESVTVYQRGWRLGGKGASSRGVHQRIEEHGLHVLLGYYHSTFRMMQDCYAEIDRPRQRPACPIVTWSDAVEPTGLIGLAERHGEQLKPWTVTFRTDADMPGDVHDPVHDDAHDDANPSIVDIVTRSFQLLVDFHRSTTPDGGSAPEPGIRLSSSPENPAEPMPGDELWSLIQATGLTTLAAGYQLFLEMARMTTSGGPWPGPIAAVQAAMRSAQRDLEDAIGGSDLGPLRTLVDLVFTNLRGIVADGLFSQERRFEAINHLDYRDWLALHGAGEATLDSGIVRGMYDLVFAYTAGDVDRPGFAAGLGLDLSTKMLLEYRGGIFWRMQAGMGEVVFAPLYEALAARGVDFEFFHNVEELRLTPDRSAIGTIAMTRQARASEYAPLVEVAGLPAWPARPLYDQLDPEVRGRLDASESIWHDATDGTPIELQAGRDFDVAVLALSIGILPQVCPELIRTNPRWQAMVDGIGTVATKALQLWTTEKEETMGWPGPPGVTLSGYAPPFETWASFGHLIDREAWPIDSEPKSIAYFCSVLPDPPHLNAPTGAAPPTEADARLAHDAVLADAERFLQQKVSGLWPNAVDGSGFAWSLLAGSGPPDPQRLRQQYWRANVDPSDRYVQSLPGSDRLRLRPDGSGYDNLVLAGDWTDCGLNAGCIEAAVRSGSLAAKAIAAHHAGMGRRGHE